MWLVMWHRHLNPQQISKTDRQIKKYMEKAHTGPASLSAHMRAGPSCTGSRAHCPGWLAVRWGWWWRQWRLRCPLVTHTRKRRRILQTTFPEKNRQARKVLSDTRRQNQSLVLWFRQDSSYKRSQNQQLKWCILQCGGWKQPVACDKAPSALLKQNIHSVV